MFPRVIRKKRYNKNNSPCRLLYQKLIIHFATLNTRNPLENDFKFERNMIYRK